MNHSEKLLILKKISDHLVLNGDLVDDVGLCFGKMGIAIFLYHYSNFTGSLLYHEFANQVLDESFEHIHEELPISFGDGYCGIGWSVEYLLHSGFIGGDSNLMLINIDNIVIDQGLSQLNDSTLFTGMEGILNYILFRLYSNNGISFPFEKETLVKLIAIANQILEDRNSSELVKLASQILLWENNRSVDYDPEAILSNIVGNNINLNVDIYSLSLGLRGGCSGIGLKLIKSLS